MWMHRLARPDADPAFEEEFHGDPADETGDANWGEMIMDTVITKRAHSAIVRAVQDAQQNEDPALRQEARTWLWVCCPDLADELDLPDPQASEISGDVAAYAQRAA